MAIKIFLVYILIGVILSIFGFARADVDVKTDTPYIVIALMATTLIWPAFFIVGLFGIIKELKEKR